MTQPGVVFPPKPGWWVRKERTGINMGTWGWVGTARGGAARLGHGAGAYGWTSAAGRGTNRYDTFTRSDSTTSAGPNWINKAQKVGVHSGKAYPVVNLGWTAAVWNTPMPSDDFLVSATIYTDADYGNGATVLYFGCNDAGTDVLACTVYPSSNKTGLIRKSSWTTTSWDYIGSAVGTHTYVWGDAVSVERLGNVYTVRLNGDPCWTWTDSGATQPIDSAHRLVGIGGVRYYSKTFDIDNFLAKEL